jgi:hypothetical protein
VSIIHSIKANKFKFTKGFWGFGVLALVNLNLFALME